MLHLVFFSQSSLSLLFFFFFFNDTATTEIYTLSLHDALPISECGMRSAEWKGGRQFRIPHSALAVERSEEHTSELQSQSNLVCRLLLEKKKKKTRSTYIIKVSMMFIYSHYRTMTDSYTEDCHI